MKEFLKDLARWWDDPVTQAVLAGIGAAIVLGGIDRANRSVDNAHDRIDRLEESWARAHYSGKAEA